MWIERAIKPQQSIELEQTYKESRYSIVLDRAILRENDIRSLASLYDGNSNLQVRTIRLENSVLGQ